MADHFHLVAEHLPWLVETIELGVHLHAQVIIVHTVESVDGIAMDVSDGIRIVALLDFLHIPAFGIVERRHHIEILEECESGTHRDAMLEPVSPLTQPRLQKQVILRTDGVGYASCILQGDLFVPAFFTRRLLALERIESVQGDVQVRERNTDGRVACVLRHIEGTRQVQSDGREGVRIAHTGSLRIVGVQGRIIQTAQVTAVIATGRKVHIGREATVRACLLILTMAPRDFKVFGHHIVRHVLFAGLGHEVAGIERTRILVALVIVGLGSKPPRSLRKDFAQHFQVHIVADGEIVSPVAQIEASVHFIPESRHDETR